MFATGQIRSHRRGDVTVLSVTGTLSEVVAELHRSTLLAFAEEPQAVVCDLTDVVDDDDPDAIAILTSAGAQVRDWPLAPLAICCPDERMRARLLDHPESRYLTIAPTMEQALQVPDGWVSPAAARLRLRPRHTASHAAREFVRQTCQTWGLTNGVDAARVVVSELVANALLHACTRMDLSLSLHHARLSLAVRDYNAALPRIRGEDPESLNGRGLVLVDGFSRSWGALPTAEGGKVVWAVVDVSQDARSPRAGGRRRR
jgi:hypothetical protein